MTRIGVIGGSLLLFLLVSCAGDSTRLIEDHSRDNLTRSGYGPLRSAPEQLDIGSPQLDDETLITAWTEFLSGTLMVDETDGTPVFSLCRDGSAILHKQIARAYVSVPWIWRVSPLVVPSNLAADGMMFKPNSIIVRLGVPDHRGGPSSQFTLAVDGGVLIPPHPIFWNRGANDWVAVDSRDCN